MNRTTAFGTWHFAKQYLDAAELVEAAAKNNTDLAAPRYYLLGHSIELALKAFLLAKGVPLKELRSMKSMGHDLEKALSRAEALGIAELAPLTSEERGSIELLNATYKLKEHEYIRTGATRWPQTSTLFSILKKVLPVIKAVCLETTLKEKNS